MRIGQAFRRDRWAHLGKATVSLLVNSDNVILDDIWGRRADHGTGVGWAGIDIFAAHALEVPVTRA